MFLYVFMKSKSTLIQGEASINVEITPHVIGTSRPWYLSSGLERIQKQDPNSQEKVYSESKEQHWKESFQLVSQRAPLGFGLGLFSTS